MGGPVTKLYSGNPIHARFLGSKVMKTYNLLIRLVTPKLKDPLSKAEEPGQPFHLVLPITPIATQSPGERDGCA